MSRAEGGSERKLPFQSCLIGGGGVGSTRPTIPTPRQVSRAVEGVRASGAPGRRAAKLGQGGVTACERGLVSEAV